MSSPLLVRDTKFVRVSRCVLGGLIQVAMQKEKKKPYLDSTNERQCMPLNK